MVSPRSGAEIPTGAHPGNTGGKKGRSGRKPDAFKELCRELASGRATVASVRKILKDSTHPQFTAALRWASENGYGKPLQDVKIEHDVSDRLAERLAQARKRVSNI